MDKPKGKKEQSKISSELGRLEAIVAWFEGQEAVDVEEGLVKVKEGAALIKDLKVRLKSVQNEFQEIKKDLAEE
jgi:exonuclease VII small subunit